MLGNIEVGCIGMGCMGFSHAHGDPAPREECIKMIRKAHELGLLYLIRQMFMLMVIMKY
ncbi:hypothetical protein SD457_19175 [Coprobacillaceae bacterium CR2/5/TPMF4]|nr:hypothetical protein SD457_19175 [Coprobacillaceae bacterium CR2/5/TPMF4]